MAAKIDRDKQRKSGGGLADWIGLRGGGLAALRGLRQRFSNEPPLLSHTAAAVCDDSQRAGTLAGDLQMCDEDSADVCLTCRGGKNK